MSDKREKLSRFEIVVLRMIAMHGGSSRPIRLHQKFGEPICKLWRRGIVEIWWRNPPSNLPMPRGPFYALTVYGARIADAFLHPVSKNPAPRGLSGAEL